MQGPSTKPSEPPSQPIQPPSAPPTPPTSDSETDSVVRPSIYSHQPQPRPAPLEQYYGVEPRNLHILSELKSDRLEGLYNLSFFVLAFCLIYMFVRNIVETGFLTGPSIVCTKEVLRDLKTSVLLTLPLPFLLLLAYAIVLLLSKRVIHVHTAALLHGMGIVTFLLIAVLLLSQARLHPMFGLLQGLLQVIVLLKNHSYVLTNILLAEETAQRREARRRNETASVSSLDSRARNGQAKEGVYYPRNVNLANFAYFVVAPTLVYETSYPRTRCVRKRYVAMYSVEVLFCAVIEYVLVRQFSIPIMLAGAKTDRLWWFCIKLALPSFITWLVMFWMIFHCFLSIIAELTRFADRQFYREWWNATTIQQFWRTWNMPVHEWCVRHLYAEAVKLHHVSPEAAAFGTFLTSALLHEYVCAVAFGMIRPYMFCGMLVQVPLIKISNRWQGQRRGNLFMWLMLFVGQSACALLYVRDYVTSRGAWTCSD